jgi:DHA1 family multidrug resistance protein-like MFS transporter
MGACAVPLATQAERSGDTGGPEQPMAERPRRGPAERARMPAESAQDGRLDGGRRVRGRAASLVRSGAPGDSERLLWTLGIGAFGLAWPTATVAAYLPTVLRSFTGSDALIGAVLAAEGVFALLLPLVVGPLSDATVTPLGRRHPYLVFSVLPMAFAVGLVASMSTLWATAGLLFVFFFATYVYEPPWRGLYADLLPPEVAGRGQAASHVMRGLAMAGALVGGGLALSVWQPLPFVLAGAVTAVACGLVPLLVHEPGLGRRHFTGSWKTLRVPFEIVRSERVVRLFLVANVAWETTFAGMRTFVVLYIVEGLGQSLAVSSFVLAVVTVGYALAAVGLGPFADRLGVGRVILWASVVYGGGLLLAGLASQWHSWYYVPIFVVSVAGGTVMTLAWALLFKLMPGHDQGAAAGLAVTTRGVGLLVGPPVVGLAIDLFRPVLEQTQGYAIVWPAVSLPILVVVPIVARLARAERGLSAGGNGR